MMRSLLTSFFTLATLATTTSLVAAAPVLHLEDLRKGVSLASPRISPDGTHVALLVRRADLEKDRTNVDLVIVNVATRATRTLVHDGRVARFAWSPHGDAIAYIAAPKYGDDKSAQLFTLSLHGGEPVQLTHEKNGVDAFDWRPDGNAFVYASRVDAPNQAAIDAHADAFNITEEAWTAQDAPTPEHLYAIAVTGGTAHRVGRGPWSLDGGFTYAADGRSIYATRIPAGVHPNRYLSRDLVRIDAGTGSTSALPRLGPAQSDPVRSPDGRRLAFTFSNPRGTMQTELALADANGNDPHSVTNHLDRNVASAVFTPDDALLVTANDVTQRRIFRVSPSGAVSRYSFGTLSVTDGPSVARDGTLAFVATTPTHPAELYVLRSHATTPTALTTYNDWIRGYTLGESSTITWRSTDGFTPDGVLTAPPGWHRGSRAPLVVFIHGGPTSTSLTAYSGFAQVLAAHGWFVFQPNYRGSDNLGLAFARTTVPHIASVPGDDIEAGLAAVLKLGVVDPSRIGVSGWSEGGLMTSWLITHDTRWKAAVSCAAVNDWIGYAAMTDSKDFTPQFIGSSPWTNPSLHAIYDAESPLTYASRVKTPTLILSDAGDFRVPTPLAYAFYHEIRATGTPTQFVIYPVVGHFPSDPVRVEDVYRRWEAWLTKYL